MLSSGTTAIATTDNSAVTLLAASETLHNHLTIINEGGVAGFFSIDGGTTWFRLPAGPSSISMDDVHLFDQAVTVKRITDGSNLSGVYAFAW